MRDVAEMFGFANKDGAVGDYEVQKAKRWLRRLQQKRSVSVLFGGDGNDHWTTLEALRSAEPSLVEQRVADAERLEAVESSVATMDSRVRILASAVSSIQKELRGLGRSNGP